MKKVIIVALLMLTASSASALVSVHLDFSYHGDLSCHGRWVSMGDIGHVWVPRVHIGWSPYSYGHWAWSYWGWMWVSHEPWHVTYHYGRWLWTDYHGWVWVPGRVWAPAWVVWSYGPGWVGWSPMPPDWRYGYWSGPNYHRHHGRWMVVSDRGFLSGSVWKEKLPDYRVKNIVNDSFDTKFKGGSRFTEPPGRDYVEKTTGVPAEQISRERVKTYERDRLATVGERDQREKAGESRESEEYLESTRSQDRHEEDRTTRERATGREAAPERDASRETNREGRDTRERTDRTSERDSRSGVQPAAPERRETPPESRTRTYDDRSGQNQDQQRTGSSRAPSHETPSYTGGQSTQGASSGTNRGPTRGRSGSNSDDSRSRGSSGERRR